MPRPVIGLGAQEILDALVEDRVADGHPASEAECEQRFPRGIGVGRHRGQLAPAAVGALQRGQELGLLTGYRRRRPSPTKPEQPERMILIRYRRSLLQPSDGTGDGFVAT